MGFKTFPHRVGVFTDILFSAKGAVNDIDDVCTSATKVLSNTERKTGRITRDFLASYNERAWLAAPVPTG